MANKPLNTELLDRAIVFAVRAHAGTERRGKGFPYIVHPMEAVEIVATMTSDQELMAAAALHDTVEDTDVTMDQIRAEFGDRIASLVASESDTFEQGVSEEDSWHARKQTAIDRLASASHDAKIVALGDKLSNMRAIARDYSVKGDALWSLFHTKDPKDHEWHYRGWLMLSANFKTPLHTRNLKNSLIKFSPKSLISPSSYPNPKLSLCILEFASQGTNGCLPDSRNLDRPWYDRR
jgi:myo-inositol-1(or 4)-monophosphatase